LSQDTDSESQTENSACDHEEENNLRVMNELKVFCQHLLDYNKRTFKKFMQDIDREYRERISINKKLRYENEDLKITGQMMTNRGPIRWKSDHLISTLLVPYFF
jgi:hypothetical protein